MGSGGGPSRSTTTQQGSLAPELQPLFQQSSQRVLGLQEAAPVQPFLQPSPLQIAPLSGTTQFATERLTEQAGQGPLEQAPSIQAASRAFDVLTAPGIINQATLAGLGRSTAVPQALASAKAGQLAPFFEAELGRRERAVSRLVPVGQQERDVTQAGNVASLQDFLRRQALAETALFQPFGQLLPSGIGQQASTRSSGGGGSAFK